MNALDARARWTVATVLAAMVLVVLSAAMVNAALPSLARSFAATAAASVRVSSAYQLGLVIALLPCAALGDRFGLRAVFTAGVALFAASSAACAVAPSLAWLVAARFVQGLGGAAVMALGVALMRGAVAPARLGDVIAYNALAVALSSAAAPSLGALALTLSRWPALFASSAALAVAVLVLASRLPADHAKRASLDLVSVAFDALVFAGLFAGFELAGSRPWLAVIAFAASAASAWRWLRRERSKAAPMLPLDLLERRAFRWTVFGSVACFAGQSAALVALPFYLGPSVGGDPVRAAMLLTPWPICVAITAPIAARASERWSTASLCALGAGLLSIATAGLAITPWPVSALEAEAWVALCGVGFGLFQVPNNRALLMAAPVQRSAAAGAMQATARLTGQWIGATAVTLLFAAQRANDGARSGLVFAALSTMIAAIASVGRELRSESPTSVRV